MASSNPGEARTGGPINAVSGSVRLQRAAPLTAFRATTREPAARNTAGCTPAAAPAAVTQPSESPAGDGTSGKRTGAGQTAPPSASRSAITPPGPAPGRAGSGGGPRP